MTDPAIIEQINLLKAHASEVVTAADNILKKLTIASATRKKGGLSDSWKARYQAKRERVRSRN